jgi:hypothetical protein
MHYVVVVHGIGEQRPNETTLPVIQQFAAVRHGNRVQGNTLTLGRLASQTTSQGWIEFDGIPSTGAAVPGAAWSAQATTSGQNVRFVDFTWADITGAHHRDVGETTKVWTEALIKRTELRQRTGWIRDVLKTLQRGALLIQAVLSLRLSNLSDQVFNQFLGDVEVYGNYPVSRGQAVRRFHDTMDRIHAQHTREFPDRGVAYTIVAHSLGTVLSLDAILYAHANAASRTSLTTSTSPGIVHLPGYGDASALPDTEWVDHLESFVTLGSPIDKYLVLWPENYRHLRTTAWIDPSRSSRHIRHLNYADEQDPVGHNLDILQSTLPWQKIFENGEDILFVRYAIPGVAHVQYWNDYDLWQRIIDLTVDRKPIAKGRYVEWFKPGVYVKVLAVTYLLVPVVGWLIASAALASLYQSLIDQSISWTAAGLSLLATYVTVWLMSLMMMWRQMLVVSRSTATRITKKPTRRIAKLVVRLIIYSAPLLWLCLVYHSMVNPPPVLEYPAIRSGVAVGLLISWLIAIRFSSIKLRWRGLRQQMGSTFADY